mgnify:FL=1
MIEHAIRLKRNEDLKKAIENYCLFEHINTAVILSGVGCLSKLHIRLAKAVSKLEIEDDFEIVSLNGTISNGQAHIHIAASDARAKTYGGHLLEGCLVNTTVELVLGELENFRPRREYDEGTGYDEIIFKEGKDVYR